LTGTPTLRAATGLPPVPKIQFPKVVRIKIQVAKAASPIHQKMETGMSAISPAKIGTRKLPSVSPLRPETCVRPVIRRVNPMVAPRRMNSEARVTMNEGSPVRTTT
jgi:hypothetical protein